MSKTFKGTGATDEEIANISGTINNTQSPEQLYGGIDYDLRLMQGKMQALKGQFEAGKQGKPNFPGAENSPATGGASTQGNKHKIKIGNKYYTYNGAGDTSDLKNYTEVKPNASN